MCAIFSLYYFFVSIKKIYQTLETVFHRLSSNTSNFIKMLVILSTLFSVFGHPDETLSLVFDILREQQGVFYIVLFIAAVASTAARLKSLFSIAV